MRQTALGEVLNAPAINLQRIVKSVDPLGQAGAALESTLTPLRAAAVTKIFTGFDLVHRSLFNIGTILQQPPLPAVLLGLVEQPGGGPAVGVQVELNPATLGATGDPVWALTDGAGHFQLTPPPGLLIPAGGLQLTVQGATARVAVTVPANQVASNGALGVIVLPQVVAPMPQSIIASLANIAGGLSGGGQPAPPRASGGASHRHPGRGQRLPAHLHRPSGDRPVSLWGILSSGRAATEHRPNFSLGPIGQRPDSPAAL